MLIEQQQPYNKMLDDISFFFSFSFFANSITIACFNKNSGRLFTLSPYYRSQKIADAYTK
jgi:hypothetical protein